MVLFFCNTPENQKRKGITGYETGIYQGGGGDTENQGGGYALQCEGNRQGY
jgi:hypothetical protein